MTNVITSSVFSNHSGSPFTEVIHNESLGLNNPSQLRLFYLSLKNNAFSYFALENYLLNIVSEYVFSRAEIEKLKAGENPNSIGSRALKKMRKNGKPDQKGTGNELGEILLYAFLEEVLNAPKLFSKVELNQTSTGFSAESDAVHFLTLGDGSHPSYQTIFGVSQVVGDLKDAIDSAFSRIQIIDNSGTTDSMLLASSKIFEESFSPEEAKRLADILIPTPNNNVSNDDAYGLFLGYTLGLQPQNRSNQEFRDAVNAKMQFDIQQHAAYITQKIQNMSLGTHSFYVYVLPLNNAEVDKNEIMEEFLG